MGIGARLIKSEDCSVKIDTSASPTAVLAAIDSLIPISLPHGLLRQDVSGTLSITKEYSLSEHLSAMINYSALVYSSCSDEMPEQEEPAVKLQIAGADIRLKQPDRDVLGVFLSDWSWDGQTSLGHDDLVPAILESSGAAASNEFPCNEMVLYKTSPHANAARDRINAAALRAANYLQSRINADTGMIEIPLDKILVSEGMDIFNGNGECVGSEWRLRNRELFAFAKAHGAEAAREAMEAGFILADRNDDRGMTPLTGPEVSRIMECIAAGDPRYPGRMLYVKWAPDAFAKVKDRAGELAPFERFPSEIQGQAVATLMLEAHLGLGPDAGPAAVKLG